MQQPGKLLNFIIFVKPDFAPVRPASVHSTAEEYNCCHNRSHSHSTINNKA